MSSIGRVPNPRLFSPGVGDPDSLLDGYEPGGSIPSNLPVALYGSHNNPRIVAQRGTFVIYGRDTRPMEEMYPQLGFDGDTLTRIEVPRSKAPELIDSLMAIGVTDSAIFPDLEGLSREARHRFGFEVH